VAFSDTLVVNPHVDLKLARDGDQVSAITVHAPIKGAHLQVTTVARNENPQLFGLLLLHSITNGAGAVTDLESDDRSRLADIGFLVLEDRVSTPPWFSCDLDDLPIAFMPRGGARVAARAIAFDDLVVHPTLRHFGRDGFPFAMRGRVRLANRFHPDRSWLWVESTKVCAPSVYSYSSGVADVVDRLRPGTPPPATIDPDLLQHLVEAGVIVSSARMVRQRERRAASLATAARELRERGYTVLPHLFAPLQLAAARRYYQQLIGEGFLPAGDKDWPNRHYSGRDPITHFFHQQLSDVIAGIAGQPLKPSFCFFASYRAGSVLPAHLDREQCEYAVSIQVDFSPDPEDVSPWPLYVQPPDSSVTTPISLPLGGALLYFGRTVRHYREVLTEGEYSRHWFVFYVPETFAGPLD
jgi:hypothetical protein